MNNHFAFLKVFNCYVGLLFLKYYLGCLYSEHLWIIPITGFDANTSKANIIPMDKTFYRFPITYWSKVVPHLALTIKPPVLPQGYRTCHYVFNR